MFANGNHRAGVASPGVAHNQLAFRHPVEDLHAMRFAAADAHRLLGGLPVAHQPHLFDAGELGLPEVLRAQNHALEAQADLARQRARRGFAIANLNQALGVLP